MKYLIIIFTALSLIFMGCSDTKDNTGADKVYYCPMHPEVQSDKPGVCPICHMDLVLKDNDSAGDMKEHDNAAVKLNNNKLTLANVSTIKVKKEFLTKEISAYSYLDFVEQNRKTITSRFNGRIENLFVNTTGVYIKKGQPLFEVYSPDLIQAQNDYLIAKGNTIQASEVPGNLSNEGFIRSAREKLLIMGFTNEQLEDLDKTNEVKLTVTFYSPGNGTVIEKKVQEGMYVNEGTTLYDVADLSSLWSIAEVFENDLSLIKIGSNAELNLQAYPGETFFGRVTFIYPVVNPETRTIKIRSTFTNSGNKLKPNMYGQTSFKVNVGDGLIVPSNAVLMTGERNLVYVKTGMGQFEQREVKIGMRLADNYQIISGLKEGEEIAATGGYLIDSESQLRSGLTKGHEDHSGTNLNKKKQPEEIQNTEDKKLKSQEHKQEISTNSSPMQVWNEVCPVLGNKVNSKTKPVEYKGKLIGFCCPGCDKEFLEDPEKYLSNLSKDGKEFIGKL